MRVKLTLAPLLTIGAVAGALACSATPALAASGYGFAGSFGSEGSADGQLKAPSGVAVNQSNNDVYVVDKGNNRVEWFNSTGSKFEGQFNGSGTFANEGGAKTPEPLSSPESIAVDNSGKTVVEDPSVGDVYVVDTAHNTIDKFSETGEYLFRLSGFASVVIGVAVGPSGRVWVAEQSGDVQEFGDGVENALLPPPGKKPEFERTPGIAVDSAENLYLVRSSGKVAKFNKEGATLAEEVTSCECTTGLTLDPATNELFVDQGVSVAQYGPFGEPYGEPLQFGGQAHLGSGSGIAVDADTGAVFVADASSDRIDVFMPGVAEAPAIAGERAQGVNSTAATLAAEVNPDSQATTFSFEYGTSGTLAGATVLAGGELAAAFGAQPVSTTTGAVLKPGTTYFYRVSAKGTNGETKGQIESFTTAPTPHTDLVEDITATTARFDGHLTLNPVDTRYSFDYGVGPECVGSSTSAEDAGTGSGNKAVSTVVSGLQPKATYSVCLVSSNAFGSEVDPTVPPVQFKTLAAAPTVDSEVAFNFSSAGATLAGEVNPNNEDTQGYFQYSTTTTVDGNGSLTGATQIPTLPGIDLGEAFGDQPLGPVALTSLTPGTTYYYQAVASNATGTSYGTVQSFQTIGFPLATTGEAQGITRTTTLLSGTIDPERGATIYYFKYIDQAGYEAALARSAPDPYAEGAETETREMPSSDEAQAIESLLARGLLPETAYHYELVAKNAAGAVAGHGETFTTGAATTPAVTTGMAGNITDSTATLSGTVDTQGLAVSYAFEVSTDPNNYGFPTGAGTVNIGVAEANITTNLQGLQAGTTYYYRALATSLDGTSYGVGQSFTTPGFPPVLSLPATPGLIAFPAIAFPKEEKGSSTTTVKALTGAQKLAAALKVCKKDKSKAKRAMCVKQARKKYGPVKKKAKKK